MYVCNRNVSPELQETIMMMITNTNMLLKVKAGPQMPMVVPGLGNRPGMPGLTGSLGNSVSELVNLCLAAISLYQIV